jgi:hypothetical protein
MNKTAGLLAAAFLCVGLYRGASADPIHAIAEGAYWHHDSGWIFPQKIGRFERVGIPQDVDGSRDAVAYYACELHGVRTTASVNVYPADSSNGQTTLADAKSAELASPGTKLRNERSFVIRAARKLSGVRASFVTVRQTPSKKRETHTEYAEVYFFDASEWLVKVRIVVPAIESDTLQILDAFARGQRWDTLGRSGVAP